VRASKKLQASSRRPRDIAPGDSRFRLKIRRSSIHRLGVFAGEAIPARREVIEYAGARVPYGEVLRDHERHWRSGPKSEVYLLRLNRRWVINGAVGGNGAELINHCCDPNLVRQPASDRVLFFSRRKIRAGEELTLDYHFHPDAQRIPCRCGSAKCRGTINARLTTRRR
jgi:uncharacterized protein